MRVTIIVFVSVANVKIIDIKCDLGPNDDNDDECCLLEYVWRGRGVELCKNYNKHASGRIYLY